MTKKAKKEAFRIVIEYVELLTRPEILEAWIDDDDCDTEDIIEEIGGILGILDSYEEEAHQGCAQESEDEEDESEEESKEDEENQVNNCSEAEDERNV